MKTYIDFKNRVKAGETTCEQELSSILAAIESQKDLNAYLELNEDAILSARESDKRFAAGNPRSLEGMLIAVKDNIFVKGMRATAASRMLENYRPIFNATVVERLQQAGGIVVGKVNMDELAMGSSNETSYFGGVKNPINKEYVSGGSSGGSAVAVAAGLAHTALGTDTGGSVRQPAALCGTVGFKPTYGRLSRYGVIAFASSFDQVGIFSSNIEDTSLIFDVMNGQDENDQTTAKLDAVNTFEKLNEDLPSKFKVGVLPDDMLKQLSADILEVYESKLEQLKAMGAEFHTIELINSEYWVPTYIVLTTVEASSNLARLDGVRYGHHTDLVVDDVDYVALNRGEGFGDEVKRRILLGTHFLTSNSQNKYYDKAKQIRQLIRESYDETFTKVDFMFLPTTATAAFKANIKQDDPVKMYLSDFFTTSANLAGIPAISIPSGKNPLGLPIGMQLQAARFEENKLLKFAKALMK